MNEVNKRETTVVYAVAGLTLIAVLIMAVTLFTFRPVEPVYRCTYKLGSGAYASTHAIACSACDVEGGFTGSSNPCTYTELKPWWSKP
jgi:hypothetical protein